MCFRTPEPTPKKGGKEAKQSSFTAKLSRVEASRESRKNRSVEYRQWAGRPENGFEQSVAGFVNEKNPETKEPL